MGLIHGTLMNLNDIVPNSLKESIQIRTTVELSFEEVNTLQHAIIAVERQIQAESLYEPNLSHIIIALIEHNTLTYEEDLDCYGSQFMLILYNMTKIRKANLPAEKLLVVYLEELCHALWGIRDELRVKEKVCDVFNKLTAMPIRIDELYCADWLKSNGYVFEKELVEKNEFE